MNTVKKTGGFTLVELIIVIAILAILSSVAVAGYSSYITKANDSAAEQWMANLAQHAVLANAEVGGISNVTFAYDATSKVVTVNISATKLSDTYIKDFSDAYGTITVAERENVTDNIFTFTVTAPDAFGNSQYKTGTATWQNGKITPPAKG